MTTWYVRPDTSHSATRNGQGYDTAWGGWAAIVWGGAGVVAGDTLYVCGAHTITSTIAVGNHGATAGSRVTIRGYAPDPGSIAVIAAGGVFFQIARSYTTLADLTITGNKSYTIYLFAAAPITGVTIDGCTLNGGTASILALDNTNGTIHTDLTINNTDFIGGSGSPFGSAISWVGATTGDVSTSPLTALDRVTVTKNRFIGCVSLRAVIDLFIQPKPNAGTKISDLVITGNTFDGCSAVAVEAYAPIFGRNTGVRITDNVIRNQTAVGIIGGGMVVGGFVQSLTEGFGSNVIARNRGYDLHGPTGLINVFYGGYRIFDNYGEDLTTDTIDGSGILFDHECDGCVAYGNKFVRLVGVSGVYYSGNGITILDAKNIEVYGNVVEDAYCGIHFGDKVAGQSSNIYNNTFVRCSRAVDMLSSADKTSNLVRNNIFTAAGSVTSVRVVSGTWTGESGNCFHGFGSAQGHTLHASTTDVDPELDADYRPRCSTLKRAGTYLGGKDFTGKPFYNPPNIGAVDDVTMTPRYALKHR